MSSKIFEPPVVTDEDIAWAERLFGLPAHAFTGDDGRDPRRAVLKSNASIDVDACPGSGKTTLLAAKLAILGRNWMHAHRGICVLSHTNVARQEIETRLDGASQSARLLSYPHFIGTIHTFVNAYLGIPWLRSTGRRLYLIDDDVCLDRRWNKLSWNTQSALTHKHKSKWLLQITNTNGDLGAITWGKSFLGKHTATYKDMARACRETLDEGYYCYDDLFLWATELLDTVPIVASAVRGRFPLVFIDEVQDNSELQSQLLFRLFKAPPNPVFCQRFGDANQAIYHSAQQEEGARTDPFPDSAVRKIVPNSHRFTQEIADLANPLGLEPAGLLGCTPSRGIVSKPSGRCAIFLFDDTTIQEVLRTYAEYLLELFTPEDLRVGTFTATGAVHRGEKEDKAPRHVRHYWRGYDPNSAATPRSQTFAQFLAAGHAQAREAGAAHPLVESIASAVLRLVHLTYPQAGLPRRNRQHRFVLELLGTAQPKLRGAYTRFVTKLSLSEDPVEFGREHRATCYRFMCAFAKAIAGVQVPEGVASSFLDWTASEPAAPGRRSLRRSENMYCYPLEDPVVRIRVGSIHSMKGETHTATLVLDTFYYKHHFVELKPWLLGRREGRGREGSRMCSRLRLHYVAMSRPSHLLCLAMREDSFAPLELAELGYRWRVARVTNASPVWLPPPGS